MWFILTDTDDEQAALSLGLNFSQKLSFAAVGARTGKLDLNGAIIFDSGKVDFRPSEAWSPGPLRAVSARELPAGRPSEIATTVRWCDS